MNYKKSLAQGISSIFIAATVLLSGFSFAQSWNNSNFIDNTFRAQNPSSGQIIAALFGTTNNTGTAYTNHWVNNNCVPANMNIQYVGTNSMTTTPAANTIYVLTGNQTLTAPITINNSCVAIIGSGAIVIDHNTALPVGQNSFFRAESANAGLIIDGIQSIGTNFTPEADHFLYTNQHDNITVNNIAAERFFGTNIVGGVLYFNESDNIGVFNSYIYNNPRRGIQLDTTNNVHIKNNTIAENTYGIFLSTTTQTQIENNKIHDNNDDGVYITTTILTNTSRNEIFNNGGYGIIVMGSNTNTNINTSKVYNNGSAGIKITPSTNTIISNSIIHNNGGDGIYAAGNNMVGLVIDTIQAYNNQESALEIFNVSGAILHNLRLSTTNAYDTLRVTAGVGQLNRFYGNIDIYGQAPNIPSLVAGSASDSAVINLGRTNGLISHVGPSQLFPLVSFIFCEIGVFHTNMLTNMNICSNYGLNTWSSPFINNGELYYFGERVLKQRSIPYYSGGTTLYPSNNTFNPQLYITDDSFGGWIQTTGGANYINGLIHYTNSNQLQIYSAFPGVTYTIGGAEFNTSNPIFATPGFITGTMNNNTVITLPLIGTDGLKVIQTKLSSGSQVSNNYRLLRYRDTTGPTTPTLISPIGGATFLGNSTTLQRNSSVDTGAGLSGYVYQVATTGTFATIITSGSTTTPTASITGLGLQPIYYWRVKAIDNLGQESARSTTGTFGYGFGYFDIIPVNSTFPTNSGQTFTVTAYDINGNVITGYTNTVTFSLTGANTTPQTPPANYTFTLANSGTRTFTGLLNINYPGVYTFNVMDTLSNTRLGSTTVTVTGQAAAMFSGTITTNPSTATSGTTQLTITTTAPATYQVLVNNTPRVPTTPITNTTTIPLDLSTLPQDGTYTITVILNDNNGIYTYTLTTTIVLDTINPVITIQSPATGSYQTLNQPPLAWTVVETGAGMSGYTVVMSGASLVYTAANHANNTYRSGTPLVDGPRTMTVYGYDNAGNYGTAMTSFIIDNTAPIIVSGYPHQVVITNPITFSWNVVDTGGVQSSNFMLKDFYGNPILPSWTTIYATTVTPLQLNLGSSLTPGIYKREVKVNDYVGLSTNSPEFIFGVHNAIPGQIQGFMELQSAFGNVISYGGNLYTNTTQLQAALFANMATNVAINGSINPNIVGVPLLAPFPYTLQAINLTPGDGVKNISALFTAGSLNPYSVAKQIILDTTAPTAPTLTAPINGVAINGTILLSRSGATDAGAGLSGYSVQISTGTTFTSIAASGTTTNQNINIASGTLAAGQYYRRVLTTDRVGNTSISEVASFTIASPSTTVIMNGTGAIPNSFSIPAITNANPNIVYRSTPVTVGGLANGQRATVSVSAGTLIKNGTEIGTTGTVVNGDILEIDLLASSNYNTQVISTLTVGTKSAVFNLRTRTEDQSYNGMTNTQRLQIRIIFDALVNTYGNNDPRTLTLMMTLRTAIESMLGLTNYSQAQKDALEYFLSLVNSYINDKGGTNPFNGATYTARNGRVFSITFDTTRSAYTSPQFIKPAFFSSWTAMKLHIDIHNPGSGQGILAGTVNNIDNVNRGNNVVVMPNGKVYRLEQMGGRHFSPDTISQRQFNTQAELLARLRANNPSIRHF